MTVEELKTKIEELNNLGESRDDEAALYEIGLLYRDLTQAEKRSFTWNNLIEYIDFQPWWSSGEQYRQWMKRKIKTAKKLNDLSLPENSFDAEQYQKTTQLRDYWNAIRAENRDKARIDSLKQIITFCVSQLNKLPKEVLKDWKPNILSSEKEAILMLSDLHLGVEYTSEYNSFNEAIAQERLMLLAHNTIEYCVANKIHTLHVINLGDMIQGIIHTNARMYVQYDAITQTMHAAELLAKFLNKITEAAPHITYRSCVDNHARLFANKNENIENENLYRIIDWFLEERLKEINIDFKHDNIDCGLGKFTLNNGKKVMFAHGHEDNHNQVFQHFIGATQEFIDYALLSHMHAYKAKDYQNMTVIVNGSIVGTEQYANSIRAYSKPCQMLLVFDGGTLITYKIDLTTK